MSRPLVVLSLCSFWLACAGAPTTPAGLIPGEGDARGVDGLERLEGTIAEATGDVEHSLAARSGLPASRASGT